MVHWYGDKTSSGYDVIYLFERTRDVNLLCLFTHVRGSVPIKNKIHVLYITCCFL